MSNKALVPLGLIAAAGVMGSMVPGGQAARRRRVVTQRVVPGGPKGFVEFPGDNGPFWQRPDSSGYKAKQITPAQWAYWTRKATAAFGKPKLYVGGIILPDAMMYLPPTPANARKMGMKDDDGWYWSSDPYLGRWKAVISLNDGFVIHDSARDALGL